MIYSIDAELISSTHEHSLAVTIIRGNNLNLFTTIPTKDSETISFSKGDELSISYYFGEFHYNFKVEFDKEAKDEKLYKFLINEVEIEQNIRKEKRELLELNALLLDSKEMYYGTILDLSNNGMKLETANPIKKKKIEIHYVNKDGKSLKRKGKIIWTKEGQSHYYYGLKLK